VFDYEQRNRRAALDTTVANCRQLFHRARLRIRAETAVPRDADESGRWSSVSCAFREGSEEELTSVLAADVGFWSDGGGKVPAARRPLFGREQVVHPLVCTRRAPASGASLESVTIDIEEVNGELALVLRIAGKVDGVYVTTVEDGAITAIRVVRNPDKLTYIERQLTAH
jgi:RNA polymerase sigma-70 factor (ECF subfamily)